MKLHNLLNEKIIRAFFKTHLLLVGRQNNISMLCVISDSILFRRGWQ